MTIYVLSTPAIQGRTARKTGFWARVWTAITVQNERQELAGLDDHMLNDIGMTREQAEAEAQRPIWDLPSHR